VSKRNTLPRFLVGEKGHYSHQTTTNEGRVSPHIDPIKNGEEAKPQNWDPFGCHAVRPTKKNCFRWSQKEANGGGGAGFARGGEKTGKTLRGKALGEKI